VTYSFAPPLVIYLILHTGLYLPLLDLTRILFIYMLSFPPPRVADSLFERQNSCGLDYYLYEYTSRSKAFRQPRRDLGYAETDTEKDTETHRCRYLDTETDAEIQIQIQMQRFRYRDAETDAEMRTQRQISKVDIFMGILNISMVLGCQVLQQPTNPAPLTQSIRLYRSGCMCVCVYVCMCRSQSI
jgi:hypothetical protein